MRESSFQSNSLNSIMGEKTHMAYRPLDDSISDNYDVDVQTLSARPRVSIFFKCLTYIISGLIGATITVLVLTSFTIRPTNSSADFKSVDAGCGDSVAEARANGCIFDMMVSRWEHPECHDGELLAKTLETSPVQWYLDVNFTQLVPREEIAKGDFAETYMFVGPHYHIGHCMYQWERQHRAYRRQGAISSDVWEFDHTHHCTKLVLGEWPPYVRTMAGFSACRTPDVWGKYEQLK